MSKPYYGGQAVIEGVMMRGQHDVAVAVRHPSGRIVVHQEALRGAVYDSRWLKVPFLRGMLMLWEMLVLGTRMLMYSAEVALEGKGDEQEQAATMPKGVMWGTVLFALAAGVGIFFVVPVFLASFVDRVSGANALVSNLVEKGFRLAMLVGYIAIIGTLPDIKRVFAYHGAEHKTINTYEAGDPLDVAHVRRHSTAHPRCGTSFLLIVVVVSFVMYLFLGQPELIWRVLSRIVLIPIVAGIAYELIRLGANHYSKRVVRAILSPGLLLQRLTTREPDDSQMETAIVALERVLATDKVSYVAGARGVSPAPAAEGIVTLPLTDPSRSQ